MDRQRSGLALVAYRNAKRIPQRIFPSLYSCLATSRWFEQHCGCTRRGCALSEALSSSMTVSAFFGYLFLSWGLPLASGLPFFFHRSFLSLTTVSSMFAWLALLIVISAVFRAFVPLDDTAVGYLPLLLSTVLAEEGARAVFWYLHKSAGTHLKQLADVASVRYSQLDELALAYSVGWGHGFTHMLFQFGPFLPLTWYSATWYNSKCPNLSIFSVSVLTQLGMFALLAGVLSPRPEGGSPSTAPLTL
jgi:gamma-secretase subunit APH-1